MTDPRDLQIQDKRLVALWHHWLGARGGRAMPSRRAIDPTAMPASLPHLFVYDYDPTAGRFFCRLAGEEINVVAGTACSRRYFDEIFPPAIVAIVGERYRCVVTTPTLAHMRGTIRMVNGMRVPGERLLLPLSDDGTVGDGLIGGSIYQRPEALQAGAWLDEPLVEAVFPGLPPANWAPQPEVV